MTSGISSLSESFISSSERVGVDGMGKINLCRVGARKRGAQEESGWGRQNREL